VVNLAVTCHVIGSTKVNFATKLTSAKIAILTGFQNTYAKIKNIAKIASL
jgi:hypothetical protein